MLQKYVIKDSANTTNKGLNDIFIVEYLEC